MSKTRSDSKIAPHEDFVLERLVDRGQSYGEVAEALAEEHGVQTSAAALSTYYSRHAWRWRAERAQQNADRIKEALLADPGNFDEAKALAIAQREFELAAGNLSVKDLVALRLADQRERNLAIKERALEQRIREFEGKMKEARETLDRAKAKNSIDQQTIEEIEQKLAML